MPVVSSWEFMVGALGDFTLQPMSQTKHKFPTTGARTRTTGLGIQVVGFVGF